MTARPRPARAAIRDELIVAVDTREQLPYDFPRSEVRTLKTGDYSIVDLEDRICIERKSKEDLFGSVGQGRDRFQRELERMSKFDFAAIVVECSLPDLLIPPAHSEMNPRAVVATLFAWAVRYRVTPFLAGDRLHGNALTLRLLEYYLRYWVDRRPTWTEEDERKTLIRVGDTQLICNPATGPGLAVTKISKTWELVVGKAPPAVLSDMELGALVTGVDRHLLRKET